jgi:Bacterial regulatory proteins, luxR family
MLTFIVNAEVLFWVFLAAGLAVRYLMRRPRLSAALLIGVPLIDLLLSISEATVKTHLLHIYAKLGVNDRTAAVVAALERGLLVL